eukprot:4488468-Pleurochrysis_carterae.AAC.1
MHQINQLYTKKIESAVLLISHPHFYKSNVHHSTWAKAQAASSCMHAAQPRVTKASPFLSINVLL